MLSHRRSDFVPGQMRKPVPGGLDEELGADVAAALHHDPLHVARVLVVLQGALVQAGL